jgi:hypothetical protein
VQATAILFGRGARHYRDDDDAVGLVQVMRREVAVEWAREFGGEVPEPKGQGGDVDDREGEEGDEGEAKSVKRVGAPRETGETDASLGLAARNGKGPGRGGGRL